LYVYCNTSAEGGNLFTDHVVDLIKIDEDRYMILDLTADPSLIGPFKLSEAYVKKGGNTQIS